MKGVAVIVSSLSCLVMGSGRDGDEGRFEGVMVIGSEGHQLQSRRKKSWRLGFISVTDGQIEVSSRLQSDRCKQNLIG